MRWMTDAEDMSVLEELEEAEEGYDEPEEVSRVFLTCSVRQAEYMPTVFD